VAIKLMRPELRMRRDLVRRFLREARAAARLRSPHITRVFDVGILDDRTPYIVMEYIDGSDLAAWMQPRRLLPASAAATLVVQAADAIAEAHAAGIIHRDLKPANLLVTQGADGAPMIKVLDLGICKLVGAGAGETTISGAAIIGTPAYMAPEQLAAPERADPRSDIWSLGAILYELVTGQRPFPGSTVAELQVATRTACPSLPTSRGDVTDRFAAIVARCLAVDPDARFQCVTELASALAPFALRHFAVPAVPAPSAHRILRPRWLQRWHLALVAAFTAGGVALAASSRAPASTAPATSTAPVPSPAATGVIAPSPLAKTPRPDSIPLASPAAQQPPVQPPLVLPPPARPVHRENSPSAHDPAPRRTTLSGSRARSLQDATGPQSNAHGAGRRPDAPIDAGVDPFATPD
jgi:serine/threonine-protein kinase